MTYVDGAERERRERKLGAVVGGLLLACLLGTPVLGWFAALVATAWMCGKAFVNSANRFVDVCLCLLGLAVYVAIAIAVGGNLGDHFFRMWFWQTLWSVAWLWMADARFGLDS